MTDAAADTPHEDQSDDRRPAALAGDGRWPGLSREELLGQRARHWSTGELGEKVVSMGTGDVSVLELLILEDNVYLLEPDAMGSRSRRQTVLGSLHALALDTALSVAGDVIPLALGHRDAGASPLLTAGTCQVGQL